MSPRISSVSTRVVGLGCGDVFTEARSSCAAKSVPGCTAAQTGKHRRATQRHRRSFSESVPSSAHPIMSKFHMIALWRPWWSQAITSYSSIVITTRNAVLLLGRIARAHSATYSARLLAAGHGVKVLSAAATRHPTIGRHISDIHITAARTTPPILALRFVSRLSISPSGGLRHTSRI